ncbi:MAG TPA: pre-peptidase C-terminal domain-containing protein [Anaerolineaceae bacterium]|nr:pre-peptidase C-terminal domain-containing protein [Anaerolineaceae bacterium]
MFLKRLLITISLSLLGLLSPFSSIAATPRVIPQSQASAPLSPGLTSAILQAVKAAITSRPDAAGLDPDHFAISQTFPSSDQTEVVLWLVPLDEQTQEPVATEPVLAVARGLNPRNPEDGSQIEVTFQRDPGWKTASKGLSSSLQELAYQEDQDPHLMQKTVAAGVTYGGYYLPWANGLTKHLSMGAHHTSCLSTCTYAFDFADGTMFPILAAKGGTVFHWRDTCQNNDHSCTNSLTLEDRSTTPPTYQIYLHLAQNSIPAGLKTVGTVVQQGDYIGTVDNTGYSTGHHVHFMVVTNPYLSSQGYYWGYSVDITFRDVSINYDSGTKGGRPCLASDLGYGKCVQYQYDYTSGNHGTHPPTGEMTLPGSFTTVITPTVRVSGSGHDDLLVTRMQILANYDGTWREVGPSQTTSPFAFDLDLCAAGMPDGPATLALKVYDYEGNQTPLLGLRNIFKNFACTSAPPPQACVANANQVALFAGANFSGPCAVFNVGSYPTAAALGAVGSANADSIQVGANVSATLFSGENYTKRGETLYSSDSPNPLNVRNLASHLIGANQAVSLKVQARTGNPATPVLMPATNQANTNPTATDSLVLSWVNAGGAYKFQATLSGPLNATRAWSTDQSWSIGSLPAGTYTWTVQGRATEPNNTAHYSPAASGTFTVNPASLGGTTRSLPFTDDMQTGANGWTASGLWRQASLTDPSGSSTTTAWIFNNTGGNYADAQIRAGDLTSPPISLPASPASYLRFGYQYQTESAGLYFDQRRVQISKDGGPFTDLIPPLSDDRMQTWLNSPAISLSAYAGHTVRIRFHFNIVDSYLNTFTGWAIDNLQVDTTPPPACSENPANNTPAAATPIVYGSSASGSICPAGDVDYFRFNGSAGDLVVIDAIANGLTPPSPLDPTLTLLNSDGTSVLAYNDDTQPGTNPDSRISFMLPATCTGSCSYYLKVSAWDYPGAGGTAYLYNLSLARQAASGRPSIAFTLPGANGYIPTSPFPLTVQVADSQGGSSISHVDFFVHSPDWLNTNWVKVGSDWNGADGWSVVYDPTSSLGKEPYSVYARVTDWTGSTAVALMWRMIFDTTAPQTTLVPLPETSSSTAFLLNFSGSDGQSALDHYDLQYSDNSGPWTSYPRPIPASQNSVWFVGQFGHSYRFQIRGVDVAGNAEVFHGGTQPAISVEPGCQPDGYESDNTQNSAVQVSVDAPAESHTFCSIGDVDWIKFQAAAGDTLTLMASPLPGSPAAPEVVLFQADGSPVYGASFTPTALGSPAVFKWKASADGLYFVRLRSIDPNVAGSGAAYLVWVGHGKWIYFPLIGR